MLGSRKLSHPHHYLRHFLHYLGLGDIVDDSVSRVCNGKRMLFLPGMVEYYSFSTGIFPIVSTLNSSPVRQRGVFKNGSRSSVSTLGHETSSLERTLSHRAPILYTMTEDEIYRASSQFKLWSFTDANLAELRATTNSAAAESVRAALGSLPDGRAGTNPEEASSRLLVADDVDCLDVEEEQRLVQFYCLKAIDFSDFCQFPTVVKVCETFFHHQQTADMCLFHSRPLLFNTSSVSIYSTHR